MTQRLSVPAWMRVRVALLLATAVLAGCAGAPTAPAPPNGAALSPWRAVSGGFLSPPGGVFGMPARPATGPLVKLVAPTAVALRGNDLLVVDSGAARVWRVDIALNTLTAIAGAPATLGTAVALGPDLSAWVLDGVSRQVLRFARDGRLMQTYRAGGASPSPVGFTLADGGATLLVADSSLHQWVEFRPAGAFATPVQPSGAGGQEVRGVDGIASAGDTVYVLDRGAGVVHAVRRDGQVLGSLGEAELKQPVAIAADRFGGVFVLDAQDRAVKLLRPGRTTLVFSAGQLRVQAIGGIAVDERFLAVTDRLSGQVVIHVVRDTDRP
jgi:hypothetical protein